ncbi:MAG: type II toxin-antitoxin system RatA family toxin [Burkholderiales bacterium]|nr:type II toxin-antitoxin system RatA family toxin [Burkholderiales bacterium]
MQSVQKSVLVPFAAAQMFDLVDDVAKYPEFLPWCSGSAILERRDNGKTARLDINYHGVKAHFTTDNVNVPEASIGITLRDGPFRHLHGEWSFRPLADAACKVELLLAYEFKTHALETIVGPVFNHIAHTFVDAFVHRAEAVYGGSPAP